MARRIYKNKAGERLPGVTSVLQGLGWNKQALMFWANQMGLDGKSHRDVADKAASAGTLAHAIIEAELKGKPAPDTSEIPKEIVDKAETSYLAWLEWRELVGFELIASELSLVSERYQYGGTIDVAAVKNKRCILDLKTSKAVYADHRIQVSAYGQLYNENFPDAPVEAYYILQLGKKDGSFAYHYWPALADEWQAFLHLLELHKLKKKIGG